MSDVPDRLAAALADRYRLERELGQGGMATVYLAEDRKHHRQVAVKVLRPELAASLGAERFLREIETTAQLNHPHILPLLDSGQVGGPLRPTSDGQGPMADGRGLTAEFLYYVMPYVEGESLRDRLTWEKQLPLEDALQIAREVADALSYAHSRGVIHRDIKPENILLQAGHAVVADFGIARAIDRAGGEKLTETGLAVGTPAYMSPEQAAGESDVDGRADVYALGCVLYEMLGGEAPFTGPTPRSIFAKKLSVPVPPISVLRDSVPEGVEAALTQALARTPADRWRTAAEFRDALAGTGAPAYGRTGVREGTGIRRRRTAGGVVGAALLLIVAAGIWAVTRHRGPAETAANAIPLDSTAIAVLPFQVVGAAAAAPARELARFVGALFELKVTAAFGRHIRYPGSVEQRWREAGGTLDSAMPEQAQLAVARAVGAGRLVRGTVFARGDSLTVSASVVDVASGRVRVMPVVVQGTVAGQQELVDRLIILLLAQECGCYTAATAPDLVRYKPDAIQALLAAYRAPPLSREEADLLHAALRADSSLIAAALELYVAGEQDTVALRYAWEHQDQLNGRQRAYLQLLAAPWYGSIRTVAQRIAGDEDLARRWPEWGMPWADAGELLLAYGALASVPDWLPKARRALERFSHGNSYLRWLLTDLAFVEGDAARARAAIDQLAADADTSTWYGHLVPAYRWRLAVLEGDATGAERLLGRVADSAAVTAFAVTDGRGMAAADRVVSRLERFEYGAVWAWIRGRERGWEGLRAQSSSGGGTIRTTEPVFYALLLGPSADTIATSGVRALERMARGDVVPPLAPDDRALARSWLTVWRLRHGDTTGARATRRWLEGDEGRRYRFAGWIRLIDVLLTETKGGDVRAALLRMDSVVRELPLPVEFGRWSPMPVDLQNLVLARMLRRYGEPALALAAARRRPYSAIVLGEYLALPEYLREEGRAAALTGDTAGAIRAYRHYLALREDPDPPWRAAWDSVRSELAALTRR